MHLHASGNKAVVMKGVSVLTPAGKELIRDFTFSFLPGERLGVAGPNGVGKSSLLDVIAGEHKGLHNRLPNKMHDLHNSSMCTEADVQTVFLRTTGQQLAEGDRVQQSVINTTLFWLIIVKISFAVSVFWISAAACVT